MALRFIFIATLLVGVAINATAQESTDLTIKSGESTHQFSIEIADTPELIERGLMERVELASDAGMLFDFGPPTEATMWMKNTPLSLDMLFVDASGEVIAIAHNASPNSERKIGAGAPVKAVLELNGGTAKGLDIQPGAVLHHRLFGNEEGAAEAGE